MTRVAAMAVVVSVLVSAVFALVSTPAARAQDAAAKFTLSPVMTRGSATASVTIVEFSDYQ